MCKTVRGEVAEASVMSTKENTERVETATDSRKDGFDKLYTQVAPGITRHPFIRNDSPCIAGTGLRVTDIVKLINYQNLGPAEIADYYEIAESKVNDALNYYADHTDAIDADIKRQIEIHELLVAARYGTRGASLLP